MKLAVLLTVFVALIGSPAPAAPDPSALRFIESGMETMGGRERLAALQSLRLDARQVSYRIDDSERREEPSWIALRQVRETRDVQRGRMVRETRQESPQFVFDMRLISNGKVAATEIIWSGDPIWSARPADPAVAELAPERLLVTAMTANDLKAAGSVPIDGVPHLKLSFSWRGYPVDLYLDEALHLPRRVEVLRTDIFDQTQSAWGDVRWRTDYLYWKREPNGFTYPRQWDLYRNGRHVQSDSIIKLETDLPLEEAAFTPPAAAAKAIAASGTPYNDKGTVSAATSFTPVGDGIWMVKGSWNVLVAEQPDGLLVIEAPQSSGYSERMLKALAERFPGRPVKAVVSTTDTLWHFAGLRTFVARGVPIHALDVTLPLLREFAVAPHRFVPDELERARRAPQLRAVSGPVTIGTGKNRAVVYPIKGHSNERMLMVFFPEQKLLYGSSNDVIPRGGEVRGTFNLPEIVAAAAREKLAVETYVAIHTDRMPWADVAKVALTRPSL